MIRLGIPSKGRLIKQVKKFFFEKGLELVKRISQKEKEATHEFVYAKGQ